MRAATNIGNFLVENLGLKRANMCGDFEEIGETTSVLASTRPIVRCVIRSEAVPTWNQMYSLAMNRPVP